MAREARLDAGRGTRPQRAAPRAHRRRRSPPCVAIVRRHARQLVVGRRGVELRAIRLQTARGDDARSRADGRLALDAARSGLDRIRRLDDFVPDHDHLMHLFVVSPALDRLWHLHPAETATGAFEQRLPDMPAGRLRAVRGSRARHRRVGNRGRRSSTTPAIRGRRSPATTARSWSG